MNSETYPHHRDDGTVDIERVKLFFPLVVELYRDYLKHITEAGLNPDDLLQPPDGKGKHADENRVD